MATHFYITATGPVTLSISGRIIPLNPGESQGPFSEQEVQQIYNSVDRNRVLVVPTTVDAPKIKSPKIDLLSMSSKPSESKDSLYRGVTQETKFDAPSPGVVDEPLELNPATAAPALEPVAPTYTGPEIKEPISEPVATSSTQVMEEAKEVDVQPALVTEPEPEKTDLNAPATRSRRRKGS